MRRAACGCQYDWRNPNRVLVVEDGADSREAKKKTERMLHHKEFATS